MEAGVSLGPVPDSSVFMRRVIIIDNEVEIEFVGSFPLDLF